MTQKATSKRLNVQAMIQKQRNWVLYKWKPRDVGQRLFPYEQLCQRQTKKEFLHCIVSENKKGSIKIAISAESTGIPR